MRRRPGRKGNAAARPRCLHELLLTALSALAPATVVNPLVLWRLHRSHQTARGGCRPLAGHLLAGLETLRSAQRAERRLSLCATVTA
jgi:hypothetical protein